MIAFQRVLDQIERNADSLFAKGRQFERLMKTYLEQDPVYKARFHDVRLWQDWARDRHGHDGRDIGIDLVAEERDGGYCAIQCKFHSPKTTIKKPAVDSFLATSSKNPFTARMIIDTGAEWGANVSKAIEDQNPPCSVLHFNDLASRPISWPDLMLDEPESLDYRPTLFELRDHQKTALDDVLTGFAEHDRGQLIMACGTGKTFTSLRIAEEMAGVGGRVLFLVPSISLFQQSMREWAEQKSINHAYIGICSDTRAGRTDEDATLQELEIPVTTDPDKISSVLAVENSDAMTVVFCTYHSLPLIERAQNINAPEFDLVLCDEAHRTTGIDRPDDETSHFLLVHDQNRIRASKRLYMTATPRLYTDSTKKKASSHSIDVFSMDDPLKYGPKFHRLSFSKAVKSDLLSDYKVVILTISELPAAQSEELSTELSINDVTKLVGVWRAMQNPENRRRSQHEVRPLRRAIAFVNRVLSSKRLARHWGAEIDRQLESLPETNKAGHLRCEARHVDGQQNALNRKREIDWLKHDASDKSHILTNARCLSEGIDVPALDAVIFMEARSSHVDIVQAVGRTMRKAQGKDYGYIILPVAVPPDIEPDKALDKNEYFATVWSVLRALRAHDDRFDIEINQIDLNKSKPERIIIHRDDFDPDVPLKLPPLDIPADAIYAKIVDKCGDRKYWESWAKDVAEIYARLVLRIRTLLESPGNGDLREWFEDFHNELKTSINDSLNFDNAIDMMAQHIITEPVFQSLFENYDFASGNPVARALDRLRDDFAEFGLENEVRDLEGFYESVRMRARGLDNPEARQRVLMELYEKFFATAIKKDAERLGIVYTPTEIVDFILHSADAVLKKEFGRGLSDEGVHVLDPFTGTGIFLVRLLQSALIRDEDVPRKYRKELHANELVLLAYYIAAIHIEEAFRGRTGAGYEPFDGIVLTDTFNLTTDRVFPHDWLPDNSNRAKRQQEQPIQVILGNPPWSAGQGSAADENPNVDYPMLEARISETYAARSSATLKRSLYDSYKMAIRWASDRVGKQGLVAFVTNGSWIDSNADAGVRACLAEEFSSVYVLNLLGNTRTSGERARREGGQTFGSGSRATVALTLLVRNFEPTKTSSAIWYRNIGYYLSRKEKLDKLRDWKSVIGLTDWQKIKPDHFYDWIGKRDEAFQKFFPVGTKSSKSGKDDNAIFKLFSSGYKTSRDAYTYNFSRLVCGENGRRMVDEYMGAMAVKESHGDYTLDQIVDSYSQDLRWDSNLRDNLRRGKYTSFCRSKIRPTLYRPFIKQHCYVEYVLANSKYQQDKIFPPIFAETGMSIAQTDRDRQTDRQTDLIY